MNALLPPLPIGYENRMKRFAEALDLVSIGPDAQGRETFLAPEAANAWRAMKTAAQKDKFNLLLVSGFRSIVRQTEILEGKLARGILWEEILYRSAYPGFSEHHTGRAVDVAAPGCPELVESFDQTPEYHWLSKNAGYFGFFLSYPRDNPHGIAYEPWHWFQKSPL